MTRAVAGVAHPAVAFAHLAAERLTATVVEHPAVDAAFRAAAFVSHAVADAEHLVPAFALLVAAH